MSKCKDFSMFCVCVVRPTTYRKKIISCDGCGIEYPKEDYKVLFDRQKIVYFKLLEAVTQVTFCHDCLFNIGANVAKLKKVDEISIKVTDGKKTYYFRINKDDSSKF